jgi:protein AIR1/2
MPMDVTRSSPMESAGDSLDGAKLLESGQPVSPSGQKRPRDYGEELKGLTPEAGSEPEAPSSPSPKRLKATHVDERQASESADDGEIIESGPESPVALDRVIAGDVKKSTASPASSKGQPMDLIPSSAQEPADVDDPAPLQLQPSSGWNRGVSLGVRTSFGFSSSLKPEEKKPKIVTNPTDDLAPSNENGDSQGENDEDQDSDTSAEDDEEQTPAETTKLAQGEAPQRTSFQRFRKQWQVPWTNLRGLEFRKAMKTIKFWNAWLDKELEHFIAIVLEENCSLMDLASRPLIEAALDAVIADEQGILKKSKQLKGKRKPYRRAVKQALVVIEPTRWDELFSRAKSLAVQKRQAAAAVEQVDTSGNSTVVSSAPAQAGSADPLVVVASEAQVHKAEQVGNDSSDGELWQQDLYFPGAEAVHCIYCAGTRHCSNDCPELTCKFCGSNTHSRFGCPTKRRCSQCHQSGHSREVCEEKLALAEGELEPCAFCGAAHKEDDCSMLWRSFQPSSTDIKQVQAIPTFCFTCGSMGHYGPECGLYRGKVLDPTSWSQANRGLFVDQNSQDVAIAWTDGELGQLDEQSDFHIRGKATRQTHIRFVSSDESEDEFIKAPLQKSRPRGGIKISSNIGNGPQRPGPGVQRRPRQARKEDSRRRQQERRFTPPPHPPPREMLQQSYGNQTWQPPLPTGPPPPLPPNGYAGYNAPLPQAPPGMLPRRPGAYSQGQRQLNRGGSSGSRGRGQRR